MQNTRSLDVQFVTGNSQSLKVVRLRLPREVQRLEACRVLPIILLDFAGSFVQKQQKKIREKVRTTLGT